MSESTTYPAVYRDGDMDAEDGAAWMDEAGSPELDDESPAQLDRYIIKVTQSYEVEATSIEAALTKFEEEDSTFVDEDVEVMHEDDAE